MQKEVAKEILKRLRFFYHFSYLPLEDELYKFLQVKISKKEYFNILKEFVRKGKIRILKAYGKRISLNCLNSEIVRLEFLRRVKEYRKVFFKKKVQFYIRFLHLFPQVRFIGLSGSLAWGAASKNDDIDLFIITKKNRLWTARFLAVVFAFILGLKRKRKKRKAPGKICLNLFFDEKNLKIPERKNNEYVAFELIALKPLFDKGVYKRLLDENKDLINQNFPNFKISSSKVDRVEMFNKMKFLSFFGDSFEFFLKKFQLFFINKHKTHEFITSTQLWFFPEDFEYKYKKLISNSKNFNKAIAR